MVKEFHPETQTALQILIDAGRTMHQQSYVGTKLEEALAVAWLLTESAAGSENRVGIWIFNENEVSKAVHPATAEKQLVSLRELGLAIRPQDAINELPSRIPPPRASLETPSLILGERLTAIVRLLKLRSGSACRKTGIYKALTEARQMNLESYFVVLTDLQSNIDALLEAAATQQKQSCIIVVQIGPAWRLSSSLEEAYAEYLRYSRTLRRMQRLGLTVFDVRPERLTEAIVEHIGRNTGPA
jgi:uncharacterized protein (DUF58 family)